MKEINRIIRLIVKGELTQQRVRAITMLEKSQIQHLVNQRIANSFKPSTSIYQCLVSKRPADIDLSVVSKNSRGQTCVDIFGRLTPIFNY